MIQSTLDRLSDPFVINVITNYDVVESNVASCRRRSPCPDILPRGLKEEVEDPSPPKGLMDIVAFFCKD